MIQRDPRLDMQVPDRILLAGGDQHIASRSTPRELQLDNAIFPPTMEQVRVTTPPRSIRLDSFSYPSATDDETNSTATMEEPRSLGSPVKQPYAGGGGGIGGGAGSRYRTPIKADSNQELNLRDSTSLALLSSDSQEHLTPHQEIQMVRRQMAKMNHRLMAVELENQQQQQREMLLTVLVSIYFIGKVVMFVNRSM